MAATITNYVLVVCWIFLVRIGTSTAWEANFQPNSTSLHMAESKTINLTLTGLNSVELIQFDAELIILSDNADILHIEEKVKFDDIIDETWSGLFNITGIFLGTTKVHANISLNGQTQRSNQSMSVTIIREERLIDRIFTGSVIALVSILYINFGAALDLGKVKEILVRPIGPLIAFVCQFLFMPLVITTFII